MRNTATVALGLVLLAACTPTVPDSGAGVGFGDYSTFELRRAQAEAAERGRMQGMQPVISTEVPQAPPVGVSQLPPPGTVQTLPLPGTVQATLPPPGTVQPPPGTLPPPGQIPQTAVPPLPVPPPLPTAAPQTPTGMSDEQDFDAVAARESIESDAQRLAEQRAQYVQVQPGALPERQGASDTVVIDYALSTSNAVGQKLYDRGRFSQDRFFRACARFGSQDAAQEEFLTSGGPQRDPKYLDPDGDGFACFWDPAPFRMARLGAVAAPVAREVVPGGG